MTDTRTPLEVIRDALKDIASSECGCSPVCLCDSEESLRIYKENAQDCARKALAALAKIESAEPVRGLPTGFEAAFDDARDEILHGRNHLEGMLDNDQTNAVLSTLDSMYEAAYEAVSEPPAEPQAGQWQPIETAPKYPAGAVPVLVYGAKRLEWAVASRDVDNSWQMESSNDWHSMYTPTHWMPLPAPPVAETK